MSQTLEITEPPTGFWTTAKEAIVGTKRDLTKIPLSTAIILLAVPMILEMVMESVFAVADVFFVGKLGANSIAVVGITESLMTMVYAVAMGLSIGATATVARRIGEGDKTGATVSAVHVLYLGVIVSAAIGIIGAVFAPDLLRVMGAEQVVIDEGTMFTRIELGGNAVVIFLFLINAIFRGAGDAAIAMRVLWLANICNLIFAPLFIFGFWFVPAFGVTGAAIGTTLGRGLGVAYALTQLLGPNGRLDLNWENLRLRLEMLWNLAKISASAAVQMTIGMASWIGLVRINSAFGSEAIAGYTIAMRVIIFALLPTFGMSNAAATLVGQSLGAGQPERAEKAVQRAGWYSAGFLTVIGVLFWLFAPQIIQIFTPDANVAQSAISGLRIVSLGFSFYGFGMVYEQSFNGAGDTWTPTMLNLFVFWLFEIPLAYFLADVLGWKTNGIYWAVTIAFSMLAVVSVILFRRGTWKTKII